MLMEMVSFSVHVLFGTLFCFVGVFWMACCCFVVVVVVQGVGVGKRVFCVLKKKG